VIEMKVCMVECGAGYRGQPGLIRNVFSYPFPYLGSTAPCSSLNAVPDPSPEVNSDGLPGLYYLSRTLKLTKPEPLLGFWLFSCVAKQYDGRWRLPHVLPIWDMKLWRRLAGQGDAKLATKPAATTRVGPTGRDRYFNCGRRNNAP